MKIALCIAMLLCLPARAAAQAEEDLRAKARQHYIDGDKAQKAANYDEALRQYLESYRLVPAPAMLFNIGQAYRLKGDKQNALSFYKRYLAVDPNGKASAEAKGHVKQISAAIEAEKETARAAAAEAERQKAEAAAEQARLRAERQEAERKQREAEAARRAAEAAAAKEKAAEPEEEEPEAPARAGRGLRIAGIATGAAGAVGIGLGVVFGLKAKGISDELSDLRPGQDWDDGKYQDGKAAQRNMYIFYGLGTVALASGGVLYYLGVKRGRAEEPRLAVAPAAGYSGLVLSGRF